MSDSARFRRLLERFPRRLLHSDPEVSQRRWDDIDQAVEAATTWREANESKWALIEMYRQQDGAGLH